MAKLVFGLNQSLDGYVDHQAMLPDTGLFRHFIEQVRGVSGMLYGRRMYEVMRYWDEDLLAGIRRSATMRQRGGAGQSGSCRAR